MSDREPDGRFAHGVSGNPGGRPRKHRELEAALDEHRTPESLREALAAFRSFALKDPIALKAYLDRVLGPARGPGYWLDSEDLADAPDAVIAWLASR